MGSLMNGLGCPMKKTRVSDDASHVDLTVLSIFQKTVTFDHNLTQLLHNFIAFYHKIFFVGIYILNESIIKQLQICKSKDC